MVEDVEVGLALLECFKNDTAFISNTEINFHPRGGSSLSIRIEFMKVGGEDFNAFYKALRERVSKKLERGSCDEDNS